MIGRIFPPGLRPLKIFSGAFGASQFRLKNLFSASNNSGSPEGGTFKENSGPPPEGYWSDWATGHWNGGGGGGGQVIRAALGHNRPAPPLPSSDWIIWKGNCSTATRRFVASLSPPPPPPPHATALAARGTPPFALRHSFSGAVPRITDEQSANRSALTSQEHGSPGAWDKQSRRSPPQNSTQARRTRPQRRRRTTQHCPEVSRGSGDGLPSPRRSASPRPTAAGGMLHLSVTTRPVCCRRSLGKPVNSTNLFSVYPHGAWWTRAAASCVSLHLP